MNWSALEDGIHAAVVAGSGLSVSRVIWAGQDSPRPDDDPYIALHFVSVQRVGQDWLNVEDNPSPTAGHEIVHRARGMRTGTLTLQCFAVQPTGDSGAVEILTRVLGSLRLPTTRDALVASGVGVGNASPVQWIEGTVGGLFEPRAVVDLTLHLAEEISETGTYIEKVALTNQIPDPDEEFEVDAT
jgi:hypothetical protein